MDKAERENWDRWIEGDWWRAVYWPIPENCPADLLREIHWKAEYCYEAAGVRASDPEFPGRSAFEPDLSHDFRDRGTPEDHAKAALHRMIECERRDQTIVRMMESSEIAHKEDEILERQREIDEQRPRTEFRQTEKSASHEVTSDRERIHHEPAEKVILMDEKDYNDEPAQELDGGRGLFGFFTGRSR